jgi:DNA-binding MarR family transcriptional regulator
VGDDFEEEYPGAQRLATEVFANLVRTGDLLIALHNRQAWEDHRLSAAGRMVLAVIEGAGQPLEPGVIGERLIITSGSVTSLLDTLERRGLVRRLPHPDDRRKLLVEITPAAEPILDALLPTYHARERRVMAEALSPDEQAELLSMLARVQAAAMAAADAPAPAAEPRRKPVRLNRPS